LQTCLVVGLKQLMLKVDEGYMSILFLRAWWALGPTSDKASASELGEAAKTRLIMALLLIQFRPHLGMLVGGHSTLIR